MPPLVVMLVSWGVFRALGAAGVWTVADSWNGSLRFALAAMFVFTAASHFVPSIRRDLVRMVPPQLPHPAMLVTVTGFLELAGAAGLLVPTTAPYAAIALILLLIALFPANVHAARQQLLVAGRPATPVRWRLLLQAFWIAALICVIRP